MRAQRSRISTNERQEEPPELREIDTVKEVKTIIQHRENKQELRSILLKEEAVTDVAELNTEETVINIGNEALGNISELAEMPSWEGETLYPPKNTAFSKAWKFGGFRKVDGILQKSYTVCGVCGKYIKYRNSPTNLHQHLQHKHSVQWTDFENTE